MPSVIKGSLDVPGAICAMHKHRQIKVCATDGATFLLDNDALAFSLSDVIAVGVLRIFGEYMVSVDVRDLLGTPIRV